MSLARCRRMDRRAQLSWFILAALAFAILLIAGSYYFSSRNVEVPIKSDPVSSALQAHADSCLRSALSDGIIAASTRGGYVMSPPKTALISGASTAYLYTLEDGVLAPSVRDAETGIAAYIFLTVKDCLKGPVLISGRYVQIDVGQAGFPNVLLKDGSVDAYYLGEISADINGEVHSVQGAKSTVKTPFKSMLEDAVNQVFLLSEIQGLALDGYSPKNPAVIASAGQGTNIIKIVNQDKSTVPSVFSFAVEVPQSRVIRPTFFVERQVAKVGVPFSMSLPDFTPEDIDTLDESRLVASSDGPIAYSDDSALFDVGAADGRISFTPSINDVGVHKIVMTARGDGLWKEIPIEIEVRR